MIPDFFNFTQNAYQNMLLMKEPGYVYILTNPSKSFIQRESKYSIAC